MSQGNDYFPEVMVGRAQIQVHPSGSRELPHIAGMICIMVVYRILAVQ